MTEFTMDRLRENLESLKMKNTLEILDNYLERAVAENLNIVDILDHIFAEEAKSKRKRAYEKQIRPGRKSCVEADKWSSRRQKQIKGYPVADTVLLDRAYPPLFWDERRYARAA